MKCLDMYLWQIGYELEQIKELEKLKTKPNSKKFAKIRKSVLTTEEISSELYSTPNELIKKIIDNNI